MPLALSLWILFVERESMLSNLTVTATPINLNTTLGGLPGWKNAGIGFNDLQMKKSIAILRRYCRQFSKRVPNPLQ